MDKFIEGARLHDPSLAEQNDQVAEKRRLSHVMGNKDDFTLALPFSLRSRISFDDNTGELIFGGYYDGASAEYIKGDPLLLLNVMATSDRIRLQNLCPGGGSAYPRIIDFARMRQIADKVGALYLVDMAHFAGLVAGGVHPSPVPHAQIVTSTTHKTLRGPRAGMILSQKLVGPPLSRLLSERLGGKQGEDKPFDLAAAIDKTVFPGDQGGPLVHMVAAKAVCFHEAMQPEFKDYARQIVANAKVLAKTLADDGYRIISGGTDTHLMLVDVFSKGMLGSEAEKALGEAGITVNKNAIPFDTNPPMKPSGIRIGSPAITTRGMKEAEMRQIGHWIAQALNNRTDAQLLAKIRREVLQMCEAFPLYPERRAKAMAGTH